MRHMLEMNCIRGLKGNHAQRYLRMIGMIYRKAWLDLATQVPGWSSVERRPKKIPGEFE